MEEAESTRHGTAEVIARRLEVSRRELLDLGLRNLLLNYRLLRARGLEISLARHFSQSPGKVGANVRILQLARHFSQSPGKVGCWWPLIYPLWRSFFSASSGQL